MPRFHDRQNEDCGAGQVWQVVGSAQVVGSGQSLGSLGYAQVLSQDDGSIQMTKFDRRGTPLDPQETTVRQTCFAPRKTAAIHEWLCLKNPASPEKFLPIQIKVSRRRSESRSGQGFWRFGGQVGFERGRDRLLKRLDPS
jgi:hypothetical protein